MLVLVFLPFEFMPKCWTGNGNLWVSFDETAKKTPFTKYFRNWQMSEWNKKCAKAWSQLPVQKAYALIQNIDSTHQIN